MTTSGSTGTCPDRMPRPRPTRAGVDDAIEVRMTVNGTAVVLNLPARVTLADALRDHLGLTGTHIGCEHGVCGMCTVLVDGEAIRACLLFAVQVDGSDVVTVEGLGTPTALHPLQESFGHHHALQCGFCTPGFLLSSYDLLTDKPEVSAEELPKEMSGVLCRCTGYRNIMTAVAETQREFPGGIPAPGNCGQRTLVGRASGGAANEVREPRPVTPAEAVVADIALPEGDPTITVDVGTEIDASEDAVWRVFDDIALLARCLPGAELTGDLGNGRYAGRAKVSVGPIKLVFHGVAHIVEHDRDTQRIRLLAQGRDTGGAQTQASVVIRTEKGVAGTALRAEADVYLMGRIAQFGRALAGDVSRRMFEQFAASLAETATSGAAPSGPVAAPSVFRLLVETIVGRIRPLARRLRTRRTHR